jgi:hypothetical protein
MGTFTHGQRNQPEAIQSYAELTLLTVLHSGYYAEGDPAIQGLVDFIVTKRIGSTYTASLMAMALQKLNPKKYQMRIAECAQFLCDNQCENGQWDYGEPGPIEPPPVNYEIPKRKKETPKDVATGSDPNAPKDPNAPPADPNAPTPPNDPNKERGVERGEDDRGAKRSRGRRRSSPDSHPQAEARPAQRRQLELAVRRARPARVPRRGTSTSIRPVLDRARKWWTRVQNSDGGWGYNDHGNQGRRQEREQRQQRQLRQHDGRRVGALCIYDYYMGIQYKTDNNVLKGLDWLGKNFDVTKNPNKTQFAYLYYLYGLERVGMLYGTDRMGQHEWYPEGANHLLSTQIGRDWAARQVLDAGEHLLRDPLPAPRHDAAEAARRRWRPAVPRSLVRASRTAAPRCPTAAATWASWPTRRSKRSRPAGASSTAAPSFRRRSRSRQGEACFS